MKVRSIPGLQRGPALSGRVTILTRNGQIYARAWPKKRADKPTAKQQNWRKWFKVARQMGKYAEPGQQALARELTKGTGLYPGDLLMMAARGNLYPRLVDGDDEYTTFQPVIEPMEFQGAQWPLSANTSIPENTSKYLNWALPDFSTSTFWNPANPDRIIWPSNVTYIAITAGYYSSTVVTSDILLRCIGSDGQVKCTTMFRAGGNARDQFSSGPIKTAGLTYVRINIWNSATRTYVKEARTYVRLQVLGAT